jgi:hypothetical protein
MLISCHSFRAEHGMVVDFLNESYNLLVFGPVNLTQKLHTMLTCAMQIWNYLDEVKVQGIGSLLKSSVTASCKRIPKGGDIQ